MGTPKVGRQGEDLQAPAIETNWALLLALFELVTKQVTSGA